MKDSIKVAAIQMDVARLDPEKNIEKMVTLVDQTMAAHPIDLLVFPELANIGYVKDLDPSFGGAYLQKAEPVPGPTTDALGTAARKHGVYIVVGICQRHPSIPATAYNSAVLIGPTGEVLGTHHKMHIPREEKHYFYPGNTAQVFDTDLGCLGMVVCYDLVFPELLRVLSLKGAEIICACINGPKRTPFIQHYNEYLAATRANENRNYVIACNRVGVEEDNVFSGRSVIAGPRAEILARSNDESEGVLYATLERHVLFEARASLTVFRDRRPEMYALLGQPF